MVTREELYRLVWSEPMTKVAEQFGVSGSYMARVCTELRVPRPERGYWAKQQVGKSPPTPPLPEPEPGDQLHWTPGQELKIRSNPSLSNATNKKPAAPRHITGLHPVLVGAKGHIESGQKQRDVEYMKPYKRIMVDMNVTKAGLERGLVVADLLFKALEAEGHRVTLLPATDYWHRPEISRHERPIKGYDLFKLWSPSRPTVAYVGALPIGLAIVELSEEVLVRYVNGKFIRDADYAPKRRSSSFVDHTWTTHKHLPTGRFRVVAYAVHQEVDWSKSWDESASVPIEKLQKTIVKGLVASVNEINEKIREVELIREQRRIAWLAEQERWRQAEDRRKTEESIKDSRVQLAEIIQSWTSVMNLEKFFQEVHDRAFSLPDEQRQEILERLRLAREFVGTQDPLDFIRAWKSPEERYQPLSKIID